MSYPGDKVHQERRKTLFKYMKSPVDKPLKELPTVSSGAISASLSSPAASVIGAAFSEASDTNSVRSGMSSTSSGSSAATLRQYLSDNTGKTDSLVRKLSLVHFDFKQFKVPGYLRATLDSEDNTATFLPGFIKRVEEHEPMVKEIWSEAPDKWYAKIRHDSHTVVFSLQNVQESIAMSLKSMDIAPEFIDEMYLRIVSAAADSAFATPEPLPHPVCASPPVTSLDTLMQAYHAARTSDEKAMLFRHMASLIPNPEELPDALKRFQETSSSSSAEVRGITTKSNPESMLPSSPPHVISSATQKSGP